ncbi:MAG: M14 family metallopeptidase [Bacteroidia bacterium]|nr:M14 family metallopeptidase [Bacteroidia bacterium]
MYKNLLTIFLLCLFVVSIESLDAQNGISFEKYHNNNEVQQILKNLQQNHPAQIQLHAIATSPGGEAITVIEIGKNSELDPAVFVGANFEGNYPLATEGALGLVKMLLDSSKYTSGLKWYILPLPNPDASKGYFSGLKYDRTVNDFPINNDVDESLNEDGFEDLNGDGLITQMRVKDLTGTYIASKIDPRIMVPADVKKNERGEYKLYTEGIDNDGDGEYNEDGEGGINVGIAFPHLFPKNKKEAGLWPGQTPEVYGIMKFIYDRPNIAMVYTLGSSNFCLLPPKGGRKGEANPESIKIPNRFATMLGADPSRSYTMNEVIELLKLVLPANVEATPSLVSGYLGLGAAVNPMEDDLKFYTRLSEDYKNYLKNKSFSIETLDPSADKDGSFELWAYYQLGVPSFSMNLFSVPKVKEEKKTEKGAELPEKVEKKNPDELSVKDKSLLAYSEKEFGGKGFVPWQKYSHPTLGEVEIGGFVPYLESTPKPEKIDSLLKIQLPWLLQLSKKLPDISFADEKVTDMGGGVFKLELYVGNKGYLPYPTSIGERNKQPAPVVVVLDGDIDLLEGLKRTPLGSIGGNQVKKLTWLVKMDKKPTISVKLESTVFGSEVKQIKIGG